jgi:hypothetical protein
MTFVTEQQTNLTILKLRTQRSQSLVRHNHNYSSREWWVGKLGRTSITWLGHISTWSRNPSTYAKNHLFLGAFTIDGKTANSVLSEPFLCGVIQKLGNFGQSRRDNSPNSFAQFRTKLAGHAITHFSIVGFPGLGDCLRSVQSKAMHCMVFPRPISSAMIHLVFAILENNRSK